MWNVLAIPLLFSCPSDPPALQVYTHTNNTIRQPLLDVMAAIPPPPLDFTTLSWNIGGNSKCKAFPRNLLVHHVVREINPDVILLQESTDMIINDHIIPWCKNNNRTYHCVHADSKREARVLYDLRVFEPCPRETLGKVDLVSLVAKVVPPMPELESEQGLEPETEAETEANLDNQYQDLTRIQTEQTMFAERVAAIRLKHKATGEVIVFLSFHNKYKSNKVQEMAEKFCSIVRMAALEQEKTLVVAGADLNCKNFSCGGVYIPNYIPTERRQERMIDYFVSACPVNVREDDLHLSAYDIFKNDTLCEYIQGLQDVVPYSFEDYIKSLDHDPLVLRVELLSMFTHKHKKARV